MKEYGLSLQEGEHDSVDDARATLLIYKKHRAEWEESLKNHKKQKKDEQKLSFYNIFALFVDFILFPRMKSWRVFLPLFFLLSFNLYHGKSILRTYCTCREYLHAFISRIHTLHVLMVLFSPNLLEVWYQLLEQLRVSMEQWLLCILLYVLFLLDSYWLG